MVLTVQFYTMLSMAAMGIWLGAAIDTYSRFTLERHYFNLKTALNDLLFWLLQALIVFFVLFKANLGEVRIYVFIAILCGYAGYQALLKGLYIQFLEGAIRFIKALNRFIILMINALLYQPLKWLLRLLRQFAMMIVLTIWSVFFYFIVKPCYWVLRLVGVVSLIKKGQPLVEKIKGLYKRMVKRD
ncbi:spore cortex biosynthesis protein YabQ [Shouchella patagoniensis]|uniref:spore cortex biosynthesis protein YabQ n=1 Tax=Shouchella patagoniensis TaxID=228576 RepID=UPI0009951B92|nr:spore cortex biosynthesis protein YabQ [Shouchella patagoniensis]